MLVDDRAGAPQMEATESQQAAGRIRAHAHIGHYQPVHRVSHSRNDARRQRILPPESAIREALAEQSGELVRGDGLEPPTLSV